MKPLAITFCLSAASLAPMWASITINTEFGSLRNASGAVITGATTYAIVYDKNNDSSMPGGLGANESLTVGDSAMAFAAFQGKILSQGLKIGDDTVVKWGTFEDEDGVASPVLTSADFWASGELVESLNYRYSFYWFPGISTNVIPALLTEIGGINETISYGGTGTTYIGMQIPADGSFTTAISDTSIGGKVTDISRLTAVPEPTTLTLTALAALGLLRRRRA